jgi:hypothetical protein
MNSNDPKNPTSFNDVVTALRTERQYQLRRWGIRQEDGSMVEPKHSLADFLVYMQDYMNETLHAASRQPGTQPALTSLRKVVTLAIAALEQRGWDMAAIVAGILAKRTAAGAVLKNASQYLLRIQVVLRDAAYATAVYASSETTLDCLLDIIDLGCRCFEDYGIECRSVSDYVINGRDGKPA